VLRFPVSRFSALRFLPTQLLKNILKYPGMNGGFDMGPTLDMGPVCHMVACLHRVLSYTRVVNGGFDMGPMSDMGPVCHMVCLFTSHLTRVQIMLFGDRGNSVRYT